MIRSLAALLLAAASTGWAEALPVGELQAPDAGLADAERFGHFVDLSRSREGGVVEPSWRGRKAPLPWIPSRPEPLRLARPAAAPEPAPFVMRSQLPPLPELQAPASRGGAVGLGTLAGAGAGLGLVLFGVTGPRRRAGRAARRLAEDLPLATPAAVDDDLPPIEMGWDADFVDLRSTKSAS